MTRLASFARDFPEKMPSDLEMFPLFRKYAEQIIESQKTSKAGLNLGDDVLPLQVALVNFAARCYPERLNYVDSVLEYSVSVIVETKVEVISGHSAVESATELLSLPLESINLRILELEHYAPLLQLLPPDNRKKVAICIAQAAAQSKENISTVAHVDALFKYLAPLMVDEIKVTDDNRFEFEQEQHSIAQLFQMIHNDDAAIQYEMYGVARRHFGRGGKDRIEFTIPPLLYNTLQLAERTVENDRQCRTIFGFVMETIEHALRSTYPEMAIKLYLGGAASAAKCGLERIAYEFVAQAFVTYEDEITDSKAQFACITYVAAALQQIPGFSQEDYDTLIIKSSLHCSKLMLKPQSCRGVYTCSHLFWTNSEADPENNYKDKKKVLACLKRSLKIANACVGTEQFSLFVEILNKYLYFYERECSSVTARYVKSLIDIIDEQITSTKITPEAQRHYENTLDHIRYKRGQPGDVGARYAVISEATDEPEA